MEKKAKNIDDITGSTSTHNFNLSPPGCDQNHNHVCFNIVRLPLCCMEMKGHPVADGLFVIGLSMLMHDHDLLPDDTGW